MDEEYKKPWNRGKPQPDGFLVLFSSPEHKACLDCEHFRVAGMPNRACALHPEYHLWMCDGDYEAKEYPRTVTHTGSELEAREHPGQSMADVCPDFQLDSLTVGKPTKYVREYDKEEEKA